MSTPRLIDKAVDYSEGADIPSALEEIAQKMIPVNHMVDHTGRALPHVWWVKNALTGKWMVVKIVPNPKDELVVSLMRIEKDWLTFLSKVPNLNVPTRASLNPPGHAVAVDDNRFLALDPIWGADIFKLLNESTIPLQFTSSTLHTFLVRIIEQIEILHNYRLLHLDIKTLNFMVAPRLTLSDYLMLETSDNLFDLPFELIQDAIDSGEYDIYLIDFTHTRTWGTPSKGELYGSMGFTHPDIENRNHINLSTKHDIYSLAAVIEQIIINVSLEGQNVDNIKAELIGLVHFIKNPNRNDDVLNFVSSLKQELNDIFQRHMEA